VMGIKAQREKRLGVEGKREGERALEKTKNCESVRFIERGGY